MPPTSGLVALMFGPRYMTALSGVVFLSHQIGAFIGVWLGGWAYDAFGSTNGRRVWCRKVPDGADHRFALKLLAWTVGLWLIVLALLFKAAALPPEASGTVIALYPLGTGSKAAVAASAAAGAKLVSSSWFENVLVVTDETPGLAGRLKDQGALAVFENMTFAGFSFAGCVGAVTE